MASNNVGKSRFLLYGIIVAAGAVMLMPLLLWISMGETHYIDIESGRHRIDTEIAGIPIASEIIETEFSQLVSAEERDVLPQWRPFRSQSGSNPISPHFRFHSVPHKLEKMVDTLRSNGEDETTIRERCQEALMLLRSDDPLVVEEYCQGLIYSDDEAIEADGRF